MNVSVVKRGRNAKCKLEWFQTKASIKTQPFSGRRPGRPRPKPGKPRPKRRLRCGLGCYGDSRKRILPKAFRNDNKNSPRRCAKYCLRKGYRYSGVQYRRECFCGKRLPGRAKRIKGSRCNMKCPGNKRKRCGGSWAMNVSLTKTGRKARCEFLFLMNLIRKVLQIAFTFLPRPKTWTTRTSTKTKT